MANAKTQNVTGHAKRLSQNTKVRFAAVGVFNTLFDFGIFNFLLLVFSVAAVPANIVSATSAMIVSYMLNKKVVFRHEGAHTAQRIVLFFAVTIVGIWVIQNLIMVGALGILKEMFDPAPDSFLLWFLQNFAKGVGVIGSLAWNYFGYSRLVFRSPNPKEK
ncbi:MAG TPA: GtrA family protein [Candidatus Saccharimonadales bacterium]|nr:GtrA family protein [Candidatus Saccharimonadales bacterium]